LNPGGNRAALLWQLAGWLKARSTRSKPQTRSLFDGADKTPTDHLPTDAYARPAG